MKDMNEIIERKELQLTKCNIDNVTNMSYLFFGCKYLLSLPDISKWNTNKVTNMKALFYGCKYLLNLPDNKIFNHYYFFSRSLSTEDEDELDEFDMLRKIQRICRNDYREQRKHLFFDISKWFTNNVTDISY